MIRVPGGKRTKTPPPSEDEPRYLTVVHPYPLNANLELHADRRTLALWLACCTGKDVLLAMFHKPASPGMVIIEVDRDFDGFNELLGLHTWSKFLSKPSEEQMDKSSRVFYCTHNTGRQVEKSGWKRVDIEEHWFNGWRAKNDIIKYPYPKSSYCSVPAEAITGAPMCRPLPQKSFPVPPPQPAPIPGSAEWLAARNANGSASSAPSSAGKGRKAAPSDTASVASTSSRGTKSKPFSPPPALSPAPSSVMANYRAKNVSSWKRGPPSVSSVASTATSRAPSTVGSSSARSSRSGAVSPTPLTLGTRFTSQSHTSGRFDWSEDAEQFESEQRNNPPVRSPASNISTAPARRQPFDPDGPIEPSRAYEYNEEDQPKHSTVAAMADIFEDDYVPPATSIRIGRGGTRPLGIDDPDYDPWNPPADDALPANDQPETGDAEPAWKDYDARRQESPTRRQKRGKWECSEHGPLCKPGICQEHARVERKRRLTEEQEKRKKEKMEREAKRAKALEKKERKKAEAMAEGSRSGSSSGSESDTSRDEGPKAPPESDPEDWSIPSKFERAETPSTVSSARPASDSAAGSDDDDDGGASVAGSRTTNTSSVASRSSRGVLPPARVSSNQHGRRGKAPILPITSRGKAGPTHVSPASPKTATRHPTLDARSAASQNPSTTGGRSSVRPSVSGNSRISSVSVASGTGSETGSRSGSRQSAGDARSSASSGVRKGAGPSFTPSISPAANGFPTHADKELGDQISVAQAKAAREDRRINGGEEDEAVGRQKLTKSGRKRRNKDRNAKVQAQAQALAAQASAVEAELDVGQGSSWGDPTAAW